MKLTVLLFCSYYSILLLPLAFLSANYLSIMRNHGNFDERSYSAGLPSSISNPPSTIQTEILWR